MARVAGPTRVETAVAISTQGFPRFADELRLAPAEDDALAAAVIAGSDDDGPVLLIPGGPLPDSVDAEIARLQPLAITYLGTAGSDC